MAPEFLLLTHFQSVQLFLFQLVMRTRNITGVHLSWLYNPSSIMKINTFSILLRLFQCLYLRFLVQYFFHTCLIKRNNKILWDVIYCLLLIYQITTKKRQSPLVCIIQLVFWRHLLWMLRLQRGVGLCYCNTSILVAHITKQSMLVSLHSCKHTHTHNHHDPTQPDFCSPPGSHLLAF